MRDQRALPGLYEMPERVELTPTKKVNVPRSSVEAYQRTNSSGRTGQVVAWLMRYGVTHAGWPTSAELQAAFKPSRQLDALLYVRRGLSDALAKGLVEHGPKRDCKVAGTLAVTWKVRSR